MATSEAIQLSLPPPPLLPPEDCLSEQVLDAASLAASRCSNPLAFGYIDNIVPRLPQARKYGMSLDYEFFDGVWENDEALTNALCWAAGLIPERVPSPLAEREDLALWAYWLRQICKEKQVHVWTASAINVRACLSWYGPQADQARERPRGDRVHLVARPLETLPVRSSLPRGQTRATRAPTAQPTRPSAVQLLLSLAEEAGGASGWAAALKRQKEHPRDSFLASFEAAFRRPTDDKSSCGGTCSSRLTSSWRTS